MYHLHTFSCTYFYSHPREGGGIPKSELLNTSHISIHAPAKGATTVFPLKNVDTLISIHAPAKGATAHFYNFYFHMRSTFVYHAQCNKFTIYISNIKYSYIVRNYCAVPPHFHVRQTYAQLFITTKVLPLQCFFSFQKYQSYFYKNSLIDKI